MFGYWNNANPVTKTVPQGYNMKRLGDKLRYRFPVYTVHMDDHIELAYVEQGQGQETLLMVHGMGSYLPCWNNNLSPLSEYHRCIAVDLPGYGKSSKDDYPATMDFYANVLHEFIQRLDLPYVNLVGHSMGGQIALTFALKYPDAVKKIILSAPAGFEEYTKSEKEMIAQMITANAIKRSSVREITDNLKYNFYQLPPEAEFMIQDRIDMRYADDFDWYCTTVARSVMGMTEKLMVPHLADIRHPVLIFFGENDNLIPNRFIHKGTTRELARKGTAILPNAELIMADRTGHFAHFEQSGPFNFAVRYFINNH